MNLCSNHNIFLWDIVNCGDCYTMNISLKGFYKLRSIARKTGTRVVITQRYGLPFLSVRMMKRKIFLAGCLGSIVFWIWMSGFIWAVKVEGNYYITTDVFMDFLTENGIKAGIKKDSVDIEAMERAIRTRFDMVTWTSAQIDGTRLLIQVRENDLAFQGKEEEPTDDQIGTDLVAEKDGVVISIITRNGIPRVTEGMEVKKGDILVEGGIPILNEDGTVKRYDFCQADADIMLQCLYTFKEKIKEKYEQRSYTGRERKRYFIILGERKLSFPFIGKKYDTWDGVEEKKQLKVFENYYLPIYGGYDLIREYITEENKYTREEVKGLFEEKIHKFIETLEEKGVQIIEKNVTINKESGIWKMEVDFLAVEKTGISKKTQLEQPHVSEQEPEENQQ